MCDPLHQNYILLPEIFVTDGSNLARLVRNVVTREGEVATSALQYVLSVLPYLIPTLGTVVIIIYITILCCCRETCRCRPTNIKMFAAIEGLLLIVCTIIALLGAFDVVFSALDVLCKANGTSNEILNAPIDAIAAITRESCPITEINFDLEAIRQSIEDAISNVMQIMTNNGILIAMGSISFHTLGVGIAFVGVIAILRDRNPCGWSMLGISQLFVWTLGSILFAAAFILADVDGIASTLAVNPSHIIGNSTCASIVVNITSLQLDPCSAIRECASMSDASLTSVLLNGTFMESFTPDSTPEQTNTLNNLLEDEETQLILVKLSNSSEVINTTTLNSVIDTLLLPAVLTFSNSTDITEYFDDIKAQYGNATTITVAELESIVFGDRLENVTSFDLESILSNPTSFLSDGRRLTENSLSNFACSSSQFIDLKESIESIDCGIFIETVASVESKRIRIGMLLYSFASFAYGLVCFALISLFASKKREDDKNDDEQDDEQGDEQNNEQNDKQNDESQRKAEKGKKTKPSGTIILPSHRYQ